MTDGPVVHALSGRAVDELTLEAVHRDFAAADLRIHPETLERQAEVAAGTRTPSWPRACAGRPS